MANLENLLRELTYRWRQSMRISAPPWKRNAGSWESLDVRLKPQARKGLNRLRTRHGAAIDAWPRILTVAELHEAAFVLDTLDWVVAQGSTLAGPSLDVGSKNGSHLPALVAAVPGPWDLVEIDAHRRYATLATRRAHGEAIARRYGDTRFLATSVTTLTGPYATVTWTLPFVDRRPHSAWGLPDHLFDPAKLLSQVSAIVAPNGSLIIVNQGDVERKLQAELFDQCEMNATSLGPIPSALSPFRYTRYAWRWDRPSGFAVHSP